MFPSGGTILHPYRPYTRVPVSMHPLAVVLIFYYSHPRGKELVSRSAFDLHFPDGDDVEDLLMCLGSSVPIWSVSIRA